MRYLPGDRGDRQADGTGMKHNGITEAAPASDAVPAEGLPGPLASRTLFWRPRFLHPSAWAAHIPFAFWLVETCRPRRLVELGLGGGTSYFAFCQAVDKLGLAARCSALDHGLGDRFTLLEPGARETAASYNEAQYQEFSEILGIEAAGAETRFPAGSIDILHIDLELTRPLIDSLTHDWAAYLSPRAVVLLHGPSRQADMPEAAAFVEKLRRRNRVIELTGGEGLLVALIGPEQPEKLLRLAGFAAGGAEQSLAHEVFHRLGRGYLAELDARAATARAVALGAERDAASAGLEAARTALAAGEEERAMLHAALEARGRKAAEAEARLLDRDLERERALAALEEAAAAAAAEQRARAEETAGLRAELARARADLARARTEASRLEGYGRALEAKHAAVLESETWRAMEPVRRALRGLKGRKPPPPFVPKLTAARAGSGPEAARRVAEGWQDIEERRRTAGRPGVIAFDADRPRPERVTVFLATYPARRANLPAVVAALLPQCDTLQVYLNEYDTVPDCLKHEKIRVTLGRDAAGDIKDNGKFFDTAAAPEGYHVFADDDLVYPPDYVARIVEGIRAFGYRAVVGFHGTIYEEPLGSYIKDRSVLPYYRESRNALVDQLGTGTTGYHTDTFRIALSAFGTTGICDLWFARAAAEAGVPLAALERPANWLRSMDETGDTLFRQAERDDSGHTRLLREQLAPALRATQPRGRMLDFLQSLYTPGHLARAGFDLGRSRSGAFGPAPGKPDAPETPPARIRSDVHFAIIVTGWNCADFVRPCLASLERQIPGGYSFDIHVYDDGSEDATWSLLRESAEALNLDILRGERNMGPAFARESLLRRIGDGTEICVLLDLDDRLLPQALSRLEALYRSDPDLLDDLWQLAEPDRRGEHGRLLCRFRDRHPRLPDGRGLQVHRAQDLPALPLRPGRAGASQGRRGQLAALLLGRGPDAAAGGPMRRAQHPRHRRAALCLQPVPAQRHPEAVRRAEEGNLPLSARQPGPLALRGVNRGLQRRAGKTICKPAPRAAARDRPRQEDRRARWIMTR